MSATSILSDSELQAIRDRLAKTRPGPWATHPGNFIDESMISGSCRIVWSDGDGADLAYVCSRNGDHDAAFIAHARTDVGRLVAEIERLQAQVAGLAAGFAPLPEHLR